MVAISSSVKPASASNADQDGGRPPRLRAKTRVMRIILVFRNRHMHTLHRHECGAGRWIRTGTDGETRTCPPGSSKAWKYHRPQP